MRQAIFSTDHYAWNQHDPDAIVDCFTPAGAYLDPAVPDGVSGQALVEYTSGFFRRMSDAHFGVPAVYLAGDTVIVEWLLTAAPAVSLKGVDIITLEDGKIARVRGYYDRYTFNAQRQ